MVTLSEFNQDELEKLAYISGYIMTDGHLQLKGWRALISFYSKNIDDIKLIQDLFLELFKIKGRVYPDKRKKSMFRLFFISKELARFFNSIGVPKGNKTNTPFLIPEWIFKGEDNLKSSFLQSLFDTEGCIYFTNSNNKIRWRIAFEMYKNEALKSNGIKFFRQIQLILNHFGIKSSPIRTKKGNLRKDGSKSIAILFEIELKSFQNFYKHVKFHHKTKQAKLLTALRSARL